MKDTFNTVEVASGVRVCSFETDRFTTGRISFNIAVPLTEESISANSMLPFILSRSSKDYPTFRELNKKLASLYGASLTPMVAKFGDNVVIRISMSMIGNKFALDDEDIMLSCAKLLFDVIFSPNVRDGAFMESEVEAERRLATERLLTAMNDKRRYALDRMVEEMFVGEPYRLNPLGTLDGLSAVTGESLFDAYKAAISSGRIQVDVCGSVDATAVADLLGTYLERIERDPVMLFSSVLYSADEVRRVEEEMVVNQGKLVLGFRAGMTDESDYPKIKVMCDLFGGGTYSRLFSVVREKMSLCYYCSARLYRNKGFIVVQSGVENENAETAIVEIQNQLNYVATSVTEEDLLMSKRSIVDSGKTVCDTPDAIDGWLFTQILDDEIETPEQHSAKIEAVTLEDVKAAASAVTLDTVYLLIGKEAE